MSQTERKPGTVTQYNKLVRDGMPGVIAHDGNRPVFRTVEGNEKVALLRRKLREEVEEYISDPSAEELADVLEVVSSLCRFTYGADWVVDVARRKRHERGGFNDGIVLESVEWGSCDSGKVPA